MNVIKMMVNDSESSQGRNFEITAIVLVMIFVAIITLLSLPPCDYLNNETSCLSPNQINGLQYVEAFLMIWFLAEYLVRVIFANKRKEYMFSFFGFFDGVAAGFSCWFIVLLALELRNNEIAEAIHEAFEQEKEGALFRVIKIFFIFKLLKVLQPTLSVYSKAFRSARDDITFFVLVAMIIMYIAAVLVWFFEKGAMDTNVHSIPDALWWAVVTLSTVGYGDIILVRRQGK